MDKKIVEQFVESWGMMGTVWGISNSVARVHGLLIASDDPLSLVAIAETLKISKGNASMCLKELRTWEVVRLVKTPGDRQDYYVSEEDAWKMFVSIAKERKRREFNTALNVLRHTMDEVGNKSDGVARKRIEGLTELLSTLDMVADRCLADTQVARYALKLLSQFAKGRKPRI